MLTEPLQYPLSAQCSDKYNDKYVRIQELTDGGVCPAGHLDVKRLDKFNT
jgi:hypothetical protein